ncbi:MAG: hypothetical protein ACP5M4_11730 [Acidobacteriaceae bacterium]
MSKPPVQRLRKFRFNTPQRIAAILLLMFATQCVYLIGVNPPTPHGILMAACGSQLWAASSAPALNPAVCPATPDGVLAFRAAGLPLAIHNWLAGRPADAQPAHLFLTLSHLTLWLRLPFLLAGIGLGACLWWVTRRLFGDPGGYVALGFYCFTPPILLNASFPNSAILAAFGLFSAVYTVIGVAHAMQGPRRKWRKRIVLLAVTLGFTAAASTAAFLLALLIGIPLLTWLAEERRKYVPMFTLIAIAGALLIFLAAHGFQWAAFGLFLHLWPTSIHFAHLPGVALNFSTAPIRIAILAAIIGYAAIRRARYFGNTTPLGISVLLILLALTTIAQTAWLWAIPFLLTFLGGVYADLLESRARLPFAVLCGILLLAQALISLGSLATVLPR